MERSYLRTTATSSNFIQFAAVVGVKHNMQLGHKVVYMGVGRTKSHRELTAAYRKNRYIAKYIRPVYRGDRRFRATGSRAYCVGFVV